MIKILILKLRRHTRFEMQALIEMKKHTISNKLIIIYVKPKGNYRIKHLKKTKILYNSLYPLMQANKVATEAIV